MLTNYTITATAGLKSLDHMATDTDDDVWSAVGFMLRVAGVEFVTVHLNGNLEARITNPAH